MSARRRGSTKAAAVDEVCAAGARVHGGDAVRVVRDLRDSLRRARISAPLGVGGSDVIVFRVHDDRGYRPWLGLDALGKAASVAVVWARNALD